MTEYFQDLDGDGYGTYKAIERRCDRPQGYAEQVLDCDDNNPGVNPGALDDCANDIDEDCDGWAKTCHSYDVLRWGDAQALGVVEAFEFLPDLHSCLIDLNDDGQKDLVLGEKTYETMDSATGRVKVYLSPFAAVFDLNLPDYVISASYDEIVGYSLACDGDISGDGKPDLVISAPRGNGSRESGSVFGFYSPFSFASTALGPEDSDFHIKSAKREPLFGWKVDSRGDVNGDGQSDLVVTDVRYGSQETGAAFVFHGPISGTLGSEIDANSTILGRLPGLDFGHSATIAGDYNGDGLDDIVIGQPLFGDSENCLTGRVHVFFSPVGTSTTENDSQARIVSDITFDRIGYSLATVRYDNKDYLATGAPSLRGICDSSAMANDIGEGRGTVYLFQPVEAQIYGLSHSLWQVQGERADDHLALWLSTYPASHLGDGYLLPSTYYPTVEGGGKGAAYLMHVTNPSITEAVAKVAGPRDGVAPGGAIISSGFFPGPTLNLVQIYYGCISPASGNETVCAGIHTLSAIDSEQP